MRILFRFLWIMLLFLAILSAFWGVKRDEWARIKANAEIICTSCVGLGK